MRDRPILFSGPMVRAILEGRKTQTRRVAKLAGRMPEFCGGGGRAGGDWNDPTCWGWDDAENGDWVTLEKDPGQRMGWRDWIGAPRAKDLLWVRETWASWENHEGVGGTDYRADATCNDVNRGWRPSIHMPRSMSRLTLTVTDVRVQRLDQITEDDAIAEGCRPFFDHDNAEPMIGPNGTEHSMATLRGPVDDFRRLWNSLNAGRGHGWEGNPWVIAYSFTASRQNVDAALSAIKAQALADAQST
jgi:hypothetical protein